MKKEKEYKPYDKENWIVNGLTWGLFMFIIMGLIYPYFSDETLTVKRILFSILIWTVGGLGYGYTMKLILPFLSKGKK